METLPASLENNELLKMRNGGFLASRKISTLPILNYSKMERDVLKILLQVECGIIIVLARGIYRKLPKQYEEAMLQNRLLIISYENESVTRISVATAHKRNDYIRKITNEIKTL